MEKLTTTQRPPNQQILQDFPNISSLNIITITGLEPLHLMAQRKCCYGRVVRLRKDSHFYSKSYKAADFDQIIFQWKEAPWDKIINNVEDHNKIKIYTDGSKTEKGVGSAFVAFQGDMEIHGNKMQ
ncbi:hypothetical protein CEXT_124241 [Caerostris extrusa]|uniref:RNase H type-1 domain-containing protein n=1 Tax=Caerostris extrusa TaxID=172846 RepID=A0AAV4U5X3_CAEEX|nr:hypothetical protein CEXT_124241 [Caerostris extrusa]